MVLLTIIAVLALPSCSDDDDDPQPTKHLIRFEVSVNPSCAFDVYFGHQVRSYSDWEYEYYVTDLSKSIWFDCATIDNDTALLTGKIYVDGKFANMNHGNHYVKVYLSN